MALTRRAFAAATAAGVAAPTIARAKECPAAGMDWMTMSLEARNLAYFNVAHVGADFARAENRKLGRSIERSPRAAAEAPRFGLWSRENGRNAGPLSRSSTPKAPCFVHIHGGYWAARQQGNICLPQPKAPWQMAGRQRCQATRLPLRQASHRSRTSCDQRSIGSTRGAPEHGIVGPVIVTGWSAGGYSNRISFGSSKSGSWVVGSPGDL